MADIGAQASASIGGHRNGKGGMGSFSLGTPAGWAMLWWGLAVLIILLMFMSL